MIPRQQLKYLQCVILLLYRTITEVAIQRSTEDYLRTSELYPESTDGELPEKHVKAIHQPIISEAEYWLVQHQLDTTKRRTRVQPAKDFPLRDVRKKMTAGWSKGRKNYHLYYRCTVHTNYNLPGNKLHDTFERMLKGLSFQPHQIRFIVETAKNLLIQPLQFKREKHQQQLKDIRALNQRSTNWRKNS